MVLFVFMVMMVVTNLVVVGVVVVVVVVVEMEEVVVDTSPRVDRGVGDVQQGEIRLHQPLHHILYPTPEPLVQLGELWRGFSSPPPPCTALPPPQTHQSSLAGPAMAAVVHTLKQSTLGAGF